MNLTDSKISYNETSINIKYMYTYGYPTPYTYKTL